VVLPSRWVSIGGGAAGSLIYKHAWLQDGKDDFGRVNHGATNQMIGRPGVWANKAIQLKKGRCIATWAQADV
jgi:hypothetical protein